MQTTIDEAELERLENLLPDSAKQLIDVIGYNATSRLISRFGGVTLAGVSGEAAERTGGIHRLLREVLNEDECKQLLHYIGKTAFYIPRCEEAFRQIRNQRFIKELLTLGEQGRSRRQAMALLCPKYGFSDRIGWKLLRDLDAEEAAQDRLFD
ncbi:Mor transcription activator family protein [Proteus mirabilis]|uniref:Mor transcription activator family protein n=1 Tax=Proteus mirabilis TaxID=584 RepID=UPI003F195C06